MPTPPEVPRELTDGPFRARDAVGRRLLTRNQLRSSVWNRLLRDVYVHTDLEVTDAVRLTALRLVTPTGGVAHGLLAAWMHGAWKPAPGRLVPLDVSCPVGGDGTHVAGQVRRRLTFRERAASGPQGWPQLDEDVVTLDGVSVTSPVRTCFDLMRERRLVEAVVVADAFMANGLDPILLAGYVVDRHRWPGISQARVAVSLARPATRSAGESRLRMVVVLAGFPEPWINVPVIIGADARVVGIPDLTVPAPRPVGLEYDGAYHEDDAQKLSDGRRSNRLTSLAGLPLLRYDRVSVRDERPLIVREIQTVTGLRPRCELDDRDFWRPKPARAW